MLLYISTQSNLQHACVIELGGRETVFKPAEQTHQEIGKGDFTSLLKYC